MTGGLGKIDDGNQALVSGHEALSDLVVPKKIGNHEAFLKRLMDLGHPIELIRCEDRCYELAKEFHRGQYRDSEVDENGLKLRYFEHPRAVEIILTEESKEEFQRLPLIIQASLVCGSYLHDTTEDTKAFYNANIRIPGDKISRRESIKLNLDIFDPRNIEYLPETIFNGLEDRFNPEDRLSSIVMGVTKFTPEELDSIGYTKDHPNFKVAKNVLAMANVEIHGPGAAVIKAADRLTNLRTMEGFDQTRINKLIDETQKYIIPCLKKFSNKETGRMYAPLIKKLINLLGEEMKKLSN